MAPVDSCACPRAERASCPHLVHVLWSCHALTRSPRPKPLARPPRLFTDALSSQYPPRALSCSILRMTCARSRRHGRLVSRSAASASLQPQGVSAPPDPCACPRAERASCPHPVHVTFSCHALIRSPRPHPLARLPCLFTDAQSSQYPPRAVSFCFSPLTCATSRPHGRRPLAVGCVLLVAIPQGVSGPR